MKHLRITLLVALAVLLAMAGAIVPAVADKGGSFKTKLSGFEEVPAISTPGEGEFRAKIEDTVIEFELSYDGLKGTAFAAHIHLGQRGVNGAVVAFLCGGGGKPACPAKSGTVTGTIDASNIMAVPVQGVVAGDFDGFVRAIRAGVTYANVHTTGPSGANFPGGEIRGQLPRKGKDKDDED
jgi:hypothetical protein